MVDFWREYAINFGPEAAGIALTVLILDLLNERRSEHVLESQMKEQLIREMRSRHNDTALSAVEKLRVHGWIEDGTLKGVDLSGARLQTANLYRANLQGVNFGKTQLQKSSLRYANFTNAKNLSNEQLVQAYALMRAIMPDGNLYDGRFNLPRDIEHANQNGFDASDSQSMAEYLRISHKEYLEGQQWAKNNLENLRNSLISSNLPDENNDLENDELLASQLYIEEVVKKPHYDKNDMMFFGLIVAVASSAITIIGQKIRN